MNSKRFTEMLDKQWIDKRLKKRLMINKRNKKGSKRTISLLW